MTTHPTAHQLLRRLDQREIWSVELLKDQLARFSANDPAMATTWGYQAFKDNVAAHHSADVQRLVDAGAIIFGKTNVSVSLADWQTFNPVYGTTNNPWDLTRVPVARREDPPLLWRPASRPSSLAATSAHPSVTRPTTAVSTVTTPPEAWCRCTAMHCPDRPAWMPWTSESPDRWREAPPIFSWPWMS
ncbi:amidase family protein [Variovorax humicola]|uniref:Amidase family protein n=1 Tax=Variovorax humicola TaxID=1769758 RepID=A0ABU8W934_9BURK